MVNNIILAEMIKQSKIGIMLLNLTCIFVNMYDESVTPSSGYLCCYFL